MSAAAMSNAGLKKRSDFDENDSILHLVFTPRIKLGVLRIGAEWERFSFGLPDHAALSRYTAVSQPGYGTGYAVFRFNHRQGRGPARCVQY